MDAINWHTFFFMFFSLITCAFAVAVVISTNVVRMAVYLIASLTGASGLFFLAGADFVGAMQLMIYVGGTLVLLIFGVMLTAQGPFINLKSRGIEWVLGLAVGACLLALLMSMAVSVQDWTGWEQPDRWSAGDSADLLGAESDGKVADDQAWKAVAALHQFLQEHVTSEKQPLNRADAVKAVALGLKQPGNLPGFLGRLDQDGNGNVSAEEFDVVVQLLSEKLGENLSRQAKQMFKKLDADESGSVSGDEVLSAETRFAYQVRLRQHLATAREPLETSTPIGMALLGARTDGGTIGYLFPFEIISVHLLVVLIGAAYLARAKKRATREELGED